MKNEDTIRNYIKESNSRYKKQKKHFVTKNNIQVHIKDPLVNELDLDSVFNRVESLIPSHLFYNLDLIYIGQFDEFLEREMNAFYKNGAIYITNEQTDENDMIDDIIHEISHSVEEIANEEIYGDGDLELEFLGKRKRYIFHLLLIVNCLVFLSCEIRKDIFFLNTFCLLNNILQTQSQNIL